MDSKTVNKIRGYLHECGMQDPIFKFGGVIRYTPTEIADLLEKMPGDKIPEDKSALGARPFEIAFSERIKELAEAIARYSDRCVTDTDTIKLWVQEIEELCNIIWYLKHTKEEMNNG